MLSAPARTFGSMRRVDGGWQITDVEPHVAIKLKALFPRIQRATVAPFNLIGGGSLDADLVWFLHRYPLQMSEADRSALDRGNDLYGELQTDVLRILGNNWKPSQQIRFKNNRQPYGYQQRNAEMARRLGRLLIMDDIGLGKTISALTAIADPAFLPAAVVAQAHLPDQWAEDYIEPFTNMSSHIIGGTRPYALPPADIYLFKYSNIRGWIDFLQQGLFKSVIFDEMQELRTGAYTDKGRAAQVLIQRARLKIGLTASPVYNYGDEIWQLCQFLEADALGPLADFLREWGGGSRKITNPSALGAHLRELNMAVRRLEDDPEVNQQQPPPNVIVETIPYDEDVVAECEDLARQLALKVTKGGFHEQGLAAREFDNLMRHTTGVAKAKFVAAYVRMLLEGGRKVIVAGWHREVYEIWNRELADFNPVMYTGSETPARKKKSKRAFIDGDTDLMFLSLRSGTGLDGLQDVCHTAVVGELDWSPEIHRQFFGRLRRPGQRQQVDAIYLVTDGGSDPTLVDVCGVKASQARGIRDPFAPAEQQVSDTSRIKALAEAFLRGETRRSRAAMAAAQGSLL